MGTSNDTNKISKYLNTMDNIQEPNHIIIHTAKKSMTPSSSLKLKNHSTKNKKLSKGISPSMSSNKRSLNLISESNSTGNTLEILTIHKGKKIRSKPNSSRISPIKIAKHNSTLRNLKNTNPLFRKISKTKCKYCKTKNVPEKLMTSHLFYCIDCYNKKKSLNYRMDQESEIQPEICEIITNKIFLGNVEASTNKDLLLEKNITSVLVCGYLLNEYFPNDFNYLTLEFEDNEYERIFYPIIKGIEFILNNDCVFVHCRKGISRSSTIVIAYIMFHYKLDFDKAFKHVYKKKKNIEPNESFKKQLKDFHDMAKLFNYDINMIKDYSSFYFSKNKENKDEKEEREEKEKKDDKEERDTEIIKIHDIDE